MKAIIQNEIYIGKGLKLSDLQCRGAGEIQCNCGGAAMISPRFLDFLVAFILQTNITPTIDLAYCCEGWANHIGEPVDSKHRTGEAIQWNTIASDLTETEAGQLAYDSKMFTKLILYGQSTRSGEVITPVAGYLGKVGQVQLEYCYDEDSRGVAIKMCGERDVPLLSLEGDSDGIILSSVSEIK